MSFCLKTLKVKVPLIVLFAVSIEVIVRSPPDCPGTDPWFVEKAVVFAELLSTSFTGLEIVTSYFLQPSLNGEAIVLWSRLLGGLITAASFMVLARFDARTPRWVVGAATLAGMLLLPLVVEAQVYLTSGGKAYFPLVSSRYGLSLIPLALAGVALVAASRSWLKTSVLVTGLGVVAVVPTITGLL